MVSEKAEDIQIDQITAVNDMIFDMFYEWSQLLKKDPSRLKDFHSRVIAFGKDIGLDVKLEQNTITLLDSKSGWGYVYHLDSDRLSCLMNGGKGYDITPMPAGLEIYLKPKEIATPKSV